MLPQPFGVVVQVGLTHMPAGFHKHGLEGVHGDVIVCAVAAGMHQIIARPILGIPPISAHPVPGHQRGNVVPSREQGGGQAILALHHNAVFTGAQLALSQPEDACLISQL